MRTGLLLMTLAMGAVAAPAGKPGTVRASDGVSIAYDDRGKGDTTLVFIHCWACDRTFWREQLDVFSDRYRVVSLDLAGHGSSGKDRKAWSIPSLGRDVQTVADRLKLKRLILIGHSMGGYVALEAARLMPGRVQGIVAVDTLHSAETQITEQQVAQIMKRFEADYGKTMDEFLGALLPKTADPTLRQWVLTKAKAGDRSALLALLQAFGALDIKKMFSNAKVPIRAINAKPPLAPETTVEINRRYSDYGAVFMEGVGHYPQLERPAEFNQKLTEVVAALSRPRQ